jgi:STE24 endopeptidase
VDIPIVLVSHGEDTETFELAVTGVPAGWATFHIPPTLTLGKGESKRIFLKVSPPPSTASVAGEYLLRIRAFRPGVPENIKEVDLFLLVTDAVEVGEVSILLESNEYAVAPGAILDIPFNLYGTFVIEKKFGFSTITPRLWLLDLLKSLLISVILLLLLATPVLALIEHAGLNWWLWAWLFFAFFQMLVIWLYPIVIAPLFNTYEPVRNETLREMILTMMKKAGLRASGIYQVDAGKRSRHSNAYFTGIGKTKRIVLYDTLLGSHTAEEIVSVLAHEIGHWKKKHVLKQLLLIGFSSLLVFYLVSRMIGWPLLYRTFGFREMTPYAGILLAAILLKPAAFFLAPVGAMISRKFERESDRYTLELIGSTGALRGALKRLAKDNLSNLHPHPFYVWFYYSHPPLTERIRRLRDMEAAKGP